MSRTLQNGFELSAPEKRAVLMDLLRQQAARATTAPLSFAQQRLWLLAQLDPGSAAYNISRPLHMQGELNVAALRQTFNTIVARHDVLRSSFDLIDGEPVQLIAPHLEIDIPVVDLEQLPESERQREVTRLVNAEARRPFDLARGPLLRASLIKLSSQDHVLLLTMHHIVSDGWSLGVLVKEIAAIYGAIIEHRRVDLAEPPIQYADFARWQREWLQGEVLEGQLSYWRQHLAGAPAVLNLPIAEARPALQTTRGSHLTITLGSALNSALIELSRHAGATLFMTLLAAFQTLLSRYSGQQDIVVGSPIAGRNRAETEDLIGFFVNSLPLRTDLSGDPTFLELLSRVRETALGAYAHQDLPFEKIVEELQPERSLRHSPVFQVAFALQNQPARFQLPGLSISPLKRTFDTAKFDLTLYVTETGDELVCWLEYNTDLFAESAVVRLLEHYEVLLSEIAADPDRRIAELPMLADAERQQLLFAWNETRIDFPADRCVHQLFEAQVETTPEEIALASGNDRLTYRELNARANQLAHHLQKRGVGPDVLVGVCMERSIEMVVTLLGVLKAGGAYVPLDAQYPAERLAFMIEDAALPVLLTEQRLFAALRQQYAEALSNSTQVLCLDSESLNVLDENQDNPSSGATPQNLAYVIYTSGSTGIPKGVSVEHHSLMNLCYWHQRTYQVTAADRATQLAALAFDASVWEMWPYLTAGASLHLPDEETRGDAARLIRWLAAERITLSFLPTPLAEAVLAEALPESLSLRALLTGGDRLHRISRTLPFPLINHYGPTENTVVTTSSTVDLTSRTDAMPPIGRPIANTRVYVLDERLEPVPIGVAAELYLGGAGLAREYLRRPELTAERFVPHPYSAAPGARLYRTGDLVRWLADGQIEFLGRKDEQVKIRGFRIELGEIETTLREHAAVQDAVVILRDSSDGNKTLVGYVVVDSNDSALQDDKLAAELKSFLKKKLPDYMVPPVFIELDQLPLTPNGKIDRKALPEPGPRQRDSSIILRPRNEIEFALTLIWERVLNVRPIGLADNFFELGGHSLLAVRLMAEIEEEFGQRIPLVSLFQSATIEGFAGILKQGVSSISWPIVVELQRGGARPPLFCVSHPGVNALGYRSLAHYLGPDQPLYGLQAQYPEDLQGEHSNTAVDELATEYLEAILKVQPHGPYQLAGMCRGAHIAFEMARRLENRGESVALVGIFDTWVMENTYNRLLFLVGYYFRRLTSLLRNGLQLESTKEKARTANANAGDPAPPENPAANQKNPMYEVYFPGPDFAPKTYPGSVTVFRAKRQPLNRIRDPQLGWGRLAGGLVDVHVVPGKHGNVLREPNVQGLAEELKKCLLEKSG